MEGAAAASGVGIVGSVATKQPGPGENAAQLKKACSEFEAIFLSQLTRAMRKTVPESGLLDSGLAGDIYRDMLDVEIAAQMARRGGVGIGETLYKQLVERTGID